MSRPLPAPGDGMTQDNRCFGGGFLLVPLADEKEDEHEEEGERASGVEFCSFTSLLNDSRNVFEEFCMILSAFIFS